MAIGDLYRILLGVSDRAPYLEDTAGDVLSTFNPAVLGQLLKADKSYNLLPGLIEKYNYDFKKGAYRLKLRSDIFFS